MNELITIEQLPIITQRLETLSAEIDAKTKDALSMVCTDDTVKFVKAMRADLNKQFSELETQRKTVKAAILKPYEDFEQVYKRYVSNKFQTADTELKGKIADVEDAIKTRREDEVRAHFESYLAEYPQIDFLSFERAGIKVNLSTSTASLKKACEDFINRVADDVDMIATLPDKAEIMVEYIPSLNAAQSITTVDARHKAIEAQKKAEATALPPIDDFAAIPDFEIPDFDMPEPPEPVRGQMATIRLTVSDTVERIDELRAWMTQKGYQYHE